MQHQLNPWDLSSHLTSWPGYASSSGIPVQLSFPWLYLKTEVKAEAFTLCLIVTMLPSFRFSVYQPTCLNCPGTSWNRSQLVGSHPLSDKLFCLNISGEFTNNKSVINEYLKGIKRFYQWLTKFATKLRTFSHDFFRKQDFVLLCR